MSGLRMLFPENSGFWQINFEISELNYIMIRDVILETKLSFDNKKKSHDVVHSYLSSLRG